MWGTYDCEYVFFDLVGGDLAVFLEEVPGYGVDVGEGVVIPGSFLVNFLSLLFQKECDSKREYAIVHESYHGTALLFFTGLLSG